MTIEYKEEGKITRRYLTEYQRYLDTIKCINIHHSRRKRERQKHKKELLAGNFQI